MIADSALLLALVANRPLKIRTVKRTLSGGPRSLAGRSHDMSISPSQAASNRRTPVQSAQALGKWLSRPARICWILGATFLKFAVTSSGMVVAHYFGARLPGCGPHGGCDRLQDSPWGHVPLTHWPVAFVGIAYFIAMMVAIGLSHKRVTTSLRTLAWLGVAASVMFVGVMIRMREFCLYCALTHFFNVASVVFMEAYILLDRRHRNLETAQMNPAPSTPTPSFLHHHVGMPLAAFFGVFTAASLILGIASSKHLRAEVEVAKKEAADSTQRIIQKNAASVPETEQPADRWGAAGFTGRYRKGPETAAIRIVVLTDYQCPDCKRVEGEIEAVLAARTDASLSVKHFPMCPDCNKYMKRKMHDNACWAARAAEAAGILGGDAAFFKMHDWLFSKSGTFFKPADIEPGIKAAGLDPTAFMAVMQGPETLKRVQADVEDGMSLGLYSTPMVFVNGVEFKGWQVPGAFKATIDQVVATNPPAKTAAADHPVLAAQRFVDDWKEMPEAVKPADKRAWTTGLAADATPKSKQPIVNVIVYGDYQEPNTADFHKQLRETMKDRDNVRYTFRHYPVDTTCNTALPPNVPAGSVHPLACKAARAAEAAGTIAGADGYWKMHQWLMDNQKTLSDETLKKAVTDFGWDVARFTTAMDSQEVTDAITEDCIGARALGLSSIPFVIVNNRQVPRPIREGDNLIKRIVEEASKPPAKK